MKKLMSILISILFALSVSGISFAQDDKAAGSNDQTVKAEKKTTKKAKKAKKSKKTKKAKKQKAAPMDESAPAQESK